MNDVLVGTMYSGEGDFEYCCKAIKKQNVNCDHLIIKNKPEADAHYELYKYFKDQNYKYLLKVDADMVMDRNTVVEEFINRINSYDRITFYVNDFFMNSKLTGMHMYNSTMEWDFDVAYKKRLSPDKYDAVHLGRSSKSRKFKIVAAKHCHFANDKQCFRFGYRGILKVKKTRLNLFLKHYQQKPHNHRLSLVASGIYAANQLFDYTAFDYTEQFDKIFNDYKSITVSPESVDNTMKGIWKKAKKMYNKESLKNQ